MSYYYENEVIRENSCNNPCNNSYSEYSRVEAEYAGRSGYPIGHHRHHNNIVSDVVVNDVICEANVIPSYGYNHHHRHGHGGAEIIERKEERIVYENDYDPCRPRIC
ncbi:uncharacterized protein LOC130799143 [Amaranthus tricolor]|uniref:uncharacterized protein LOC130799143 n=1 Tax=Amaranthus tricolor TaxID=29722 RepID=UPI002587F009|nr:uncharacterized protein LOC130799143 [Amaranthus tricolor]XP_057518213.1 uncharacterized protein LOC130799143 [Amaranthus tricolor]XP_057518214.1 uncharacterized protein LOC130799143 [Amaranthus tricolor]XP_057518215.1 uncharacterized protein LOC130799143 [Amaranthus tricolor]